MEPSEEFRSLYQNRVPVFLDVLRTSSRIVEEHQEICGPFLMDCWDGEYSRAGTRLLIIGQETCGWTSLSDCLGNPDAIRLLMDEYRSFDLGAKCKSTPFWQYAHRVNAHLNGADNRRSFQWTNLFKLDQCCGQPDLWLQEMQFRSFNILADEVRIIEPDIVVFFTGPDYDHAVLKSFPGLTWEKAIAQISSRKLARVSHEHLPDKAFRIYHPKYLILQEPRLLEELLGLIG